MCKWYLLYAGGLQILTQLIDEEIKGHCWGFIELEERSALCGMSFMCFTKFIRFFIGPGERDYYIVSWIRWDYMGLCSGEFITPWTILACVLRLARKEHWKLQSDKIQWLSDPDKELHAFPTAEICVAGHISPSLTWLSCTHSLPRVAGYSVREGWWVSYRIGMSRSNLPNTIV